MYTPDPRTVRRMAYRTAGRAFALAALHIRITRVSIEGLWSQEPNERDAEIETKGFLRVPQDIAYAHIVAETAASRSGVPEDVEPQLYAAPDLSSMEHIYEQVVNFAKKSMTPISLLAETLISDKILSEKDFYYLLAYGLKRTV